MPSERSRVNMSLTMNPFRLELTSSVCIAAPPEAVWKIFADISRWTEWCGVCLAAEVETDFDWQRGQRIRLKFRIAGRGVPFNVAITESEPSRRIAWASTKLTVTAVRTFSFAEETPDSTVVTDHKLFTSPVLPVRLFYPRPVIRRMTESMLVDLKSECERAVGA